MRIFNWSIYFYVIIILIAQLLTGCSEQFYVEKDYTTYEEDQSDNILTVKLIGSYNSSGDITTLGNPYELFVFIKSYDLELESILIDDISIKTVNVGKTIFEYAGNMSSSCSGYDDYVYASFSFQGIDIVDYDDAIVTFSYRVNSKRAQRVSAILERNYKEFKRNKLLEILGGV